MNNVIHKDLKITLADGKERKLLFTIGAFTKLAEIYGSAKNAFLKVLDPTGIKDLKADSLNAIIDFIYYGIRHEDKKITRDEVADLLVVEQLSDAIKVIAEGFGLQLPKSEDENPPKA